MNSEQNITIELDWALHLGDRKTFDRIKAIGRSKPGILIIETGGHVLFMNEEKLREAAEAEASKGEYSIVSDLYERAKKLSHKPYDPTTDAIVFFSGDTGVIELMSNKRQSRAKVWWCRPAVRTVRHVNLEDTEEALVRFAVA